MNVKQRYRLTKSLVTANNMSMRSEITNFAPPRALYTQLRVSESMVELVESYHSLVITLQNLVALIM